MVPDVNHNHIPRQKIWAIASGKGGVGKSLLASNFSIILAYLGESVVAVDLDLGNANMHTFLGIKYPRKTLVEFLNGGVQNLNEIVLDTPIYNLKFISGSGGIIGYANPWHTQKMKLIRHLDQLHVDNIVLDLGAGTSYNTIDFFLGATNHIIITTPETTAIQSCYNFIRICVFRKLYSIFHNNSNIRGIIEKAKTPTPNGDIYKVQDILKEVNELAPECVKEFKEFQLHFRPALIMNMVMKNSEAKLGWGIKEIVKRYLALDINYVGSISFDNMIRESISLEIPHIINAPKARSNNDLLALVPAILGKSSDKYFIKETVHRELKRTSKTYNTRIVESNRLDVDPSIYAVDKVKAVHEPDDTEYTGFFRIKPTSWSKIAIDLGTSNTLIYVKNRGIILNEPSLISIEENTGKVVALGHEAKAMIGRAHSGIKVISPLESGAISDYTDVKKMVMEFIKLAKRSTILIRPGVVLTIQPALTSVEKRAFTEFIKDIGARDVNLVYEPLAAAIGAGLPVDVPKASMVVNLGGGSISAIVISISGIVAMASEKVGGKVLDHYIVRYLRDMHNFVIGDQTAEWIKMNFGQAMKFERDKRFVIRGQDLSQGIPKTLTISTAEIREAIEKPVNDSLKIILNLLEKVPPELSGDLVDRGMTLTGGGAFLMGFDRLITERTGIKVQIASNACTATVEGAGRMLNDFNLYKRFFVDHTEIYNTR